MPSYVRGADTSVVLGQTDRQTNDRHAAEEVLL